MATATASETYPIGPLREAIERTAADPGLPPEAKRRELQEVRNRINHLVGRAETLIGEIDLAASKRSVEEADASDRLMQDVAVREELLRRKMATPEQCDAMGLPTRDEVAERTAEGGLLEGLEGLGYVAPGEEYPEMRRVVVHNHFHGEAAPNVDPTLPPAEDPADHPQEPVAPPEGDDVEPVPADEPTQEADPLTEAAVLERYNASDGELGLLRVGRKAELVAKRLVATPTEPDADLPPLAGLIEVRVDDTLAPGEWFLEPPEDDASSR